LEVAVVPVDVIDISASDIAIPDTNHGFFSDPAWLRSTAHAIGARPLIATAGDTVPPVLRVAFARTVRAGRPIALTMPIGAYVGWHEEYPGNLAPGRREGRLSDALNELAEWFEQSFAFVRLALPPEVNDLRPFLWRGWQSEHRYTYRIDLTSLSTSHLRSTFRKALRKSEQRDHELVQLSGEEAATALGIALAGTCKRQKGAEVPGINHLDNYLTAICRHPAVKTVAAVHDSHVLAAVAFGFDKSIAYDLLAGTTEYGLESQASVAVRWSALEIARDLVPTFDFCGANIPSIAYFKRGFGGELVPFSSVTWAKSRFDHWLQTAAPLWKRRLTGWFT
jgi:hypothetical protein